ncbi:MAG: hypothetical protein ACRC7O_05810 [Fimbriiglobus sp.]
MSIVKRLWLLSGLIGLVALTAVIGTTEFDGFTERAPMDEAVIERNCEPLIGRTVAEVAAALGLSVSEATVFDEPPGVGRGLIGVGANGLCVQIWVARNAGIFRADRAWSAEEFATRRTVGIQVRQPGRPDRREWWAGGSRFSPESRDAGL